MGSLKISRSDVSHINYKYDAHKVNLNCWPVAFTTSNAIITSKEAQLAQFLLRKEVNKMTHSHRLAFTGVSTNKQLIIYSFLEQIFIKHLLSTRLDSLP